MSVNFQDLLIAFTSEIKESIKRIFIFTCGINDEITFFFLFTKKTFIFFTKTPINSSFSVFLYYNPGQTKSQNHYI